MRLFVGIALPADIRLALSSLCSGLAGARWVKPENMHMTLRFIGEADSGMAADLDTELSDIHVPAFDLRLTGIGNFSKRSRLRALWAGVETSAALIHLQHKVEQAAVRAGFPPEGRKFTPHVTLARFKGQHVKLGEYLEANGVFSSAPFPIEAVTLFESHLGHGGSHYVALNEYLLQGP
ncbi:MAG: RNA 2',3'-cyclic phosphodiesterase [Rhodospirillaceae bacterium]|nr:RNA 2',3'-cyclic phosphodiesterase [Rhodospirillaceae bacterium]